MFTIHTISYDPMFHPGEDGREIEDIRRNVSADDEANAYMAWVAEQEAAGAEVDEQPPLYAGQVRRVFARHADGCNFYTSALA